jgi:phosphoglycolate phosphatase-like HAD superfamily hydrolase
MPKLLLFDIDGTLILTGGAGARGMTRAFEAVFQVRNAFDGIAMPGRTDPQILADALARARIEADETTIGRFRAEYRTCLTEELTRSSSRRKLVMPGVPELLKALECNSRAFLALLTGNYSEAAKIKLEHFGLWGCFRCGAFGEDAGERNALVAVAVARARRMGWPQGGPHDVLVVGDTPLDVACAVASGARPIAVATGDYPAAVLVSGGAEIVFDDLSDTAAFLRLVDDDAAAAHQPPAGA